MMMYGETFYGERFYIFIYHVIILVLLSSELAIPRYQNKGHCRSTRSTNLFVSIPNMKSSVDHSLQMYNSLSVTLSRLTGLNHI